MLAIPFLIFMNNDIIKNTLSFNDQIKHLQKRGITFDKINTEDAKKFLIYSNYFYKLYSYRKNFNTMIDPNDSNSRIYIGLDFCMLVELSKFDRELRYAILELSLDVEHGLKRKLISDITRNPKEQNAEIIKAYLINCISNKAASIDLKWKNLNETLYDILNENYFNENLIEHKKCDNVVCYKRWKIWEFVEVIDFGNLINIYCLYSNTYSLKNVSKYILLAAKTLRNASAHNSCLIDDLSRKFSSDIRHIDNDVIKYAKAIGNFDSKQIDSHKNKTFVYAILCLLYLFDKSCSKRSKNRQYQKLYNLFHVENPIFNNVKYKSSSSILYSTFKFLDVIITNNYNKYCKEN